MTKPPPTNPRRATTSARSASKSARKPGQPYSEATKTKALAMLEADGMAEAHRRTKVPKSTLSRWAKEAGIDLEGAAKARTATATEHVRARAAEVSASTVELLERHLAQAGDYLTTVAGVNALAARLLSEAPDGTIERKLGPFGPYIEVTQGTNVAELVNLAQALDSLPLAVRDAEGMVTRAIHDLQLLKGEATERGELVVEFAVPRPTAIDPADVPTYDTQE